jgi:hypothetical protein
MRRFTLAQARERFGGLVDELEKEPFFIVGPGHDAPFAVVLDRESHEQIALQQREWLRTALDEGLADIQAGRVIEADDAFWDAIRRRGRDALAARGKKAKEGAA